MSPGWKARLFNTHGKHKVLFANACRFYYLFQHHTTMTQASSHGMIPGALPTCNHIVTTLGAGIGLVALDCRGERTKYDICRPKSYEVVFSAIYQSLPPTVRHLLIITGVPLIYPRLSLFESAMEGASTFNLATIAGKTGALGEVVSSSLNKWNGDPELLDDMNDRMYNINAYYRRIPVNLTNSLLRRLDCGQPRSRKKAVH